MFSSYQHQATSYANLALGNAHEINSDLHRRAEAIAPRFADDTADAGCTNLRPGDDQPRRQKAWDLIAEALAWNLIADHTDLVVEAKTLESRNVAYKVGWNYSWDDAPEGAFIEVIEEVAPQVTVATPAERAEHLLNRLDTEEDDRIRADYITELQDLAERHGGQIRQDVSGYGIPLEPEYRCPECDSYSGSFTPQSEGEILHSTCGRVGSAASFLRGTQEYEDAYEGHEDEASEPPEPAQEPITGQVAIRTPGKAFDAQGRHTGPGEWLTVVRRANGIAQDHGLDLIFDSPTSTGDWWAGGFVEEYPDARIIHRTDESVSVVSKTPQGARLLALAAEALNIRWSRP